MKLFHSVKAIRKSTPEQKLVTSITEDCIKKFPVRDCKEPLVDLGNLAKENNSSIMIDLVWDKKDIDRCRVRKTVAEKLLRVQKMLPKNLSLKIKDAHRPIVLQEMIFKEIWDQIKKEKPSLKGKDLYREVTNFVADPKNIPPHSTGGAIDVTLYDRAEKKEIDMGTKVNDISELAMTFHPKIKGKTLENRMILFDAMSSEGFCNIASEWWHYSYGDQVWAAYFGLEHALYGSR